MAVMRGIERFLVGLLVFLAWCSAWAGSVFVGSEACKSCHVEIFDKWTASHHDLAMQKASPQTVLGDFNNATFQYLGRETTFFRREGEYWVRTVGPDGTLEDFPVQYVFGVYPLQQLLLPLPGGKLQALTIAWDSRPHEQGGQRWYHLYPNDAVTHHDALHWTGPYLNWNGQCAECHSTGVEKNYDFVARTYRTRYEEINVACEACHGPGSEHVAAARASSLDGLDQSGFAMSLSPRSRWVFKDGASIATRIQGQASHQLSTCARCHSRRRTLGEYAHGEDLLQTHRLAMLNAPLYHADGQILDEVYVHGSFLQSKMYEAGVVCSDCHEPHTSQIKFQGNGLCAQCHLPATFDTVSHHHHVEGSAGAQCVSCHMPEKTYMGVDDRRDHSMRVPRPDLTATSGVPNACTQCHAGRSAAWAADAVARWGVRPDDQEARIVEAFRQGQRGNPLSFNELATFALNPASNSIRRSTALEILGSAAAPQTPRVSEMFLRGTDPMLRASAVRSLADFPLVQRYRILRPFLNDQNRTVRHELAKALAEVPLAQVPPEDQASLQTLFDEFLSIEIQDADVPGVLLSLGQFFAARRDTVRAEEFLREALAIDPTDGPAHLNLADLMRAQGRDAEARQVLNRAIVIRPEDPDLSAALGLLEYRSGNSALALQYLERSATLQKNGARYRYMYAIALHDLGSPEEAITQLKIADTEMPNNLAVLEALSGYLAELNDFSSARVYAQRLLELAPEDPRYKRLFESLLQSESKKDQ